MINIEDLSFGYNMELNNNTVNYIVQFFNKHKKTTLKKIEIDIDADKSNYSMKYTNEILPNIGIGVERICKRRTYQHSETIVIFQKMQQKENKELDNVTIKSQHKELKNIMMMDRQYTYQSTLVKTAKKSDKLGKLQKQQKSKPNEMTYGWVCLSCSLLNLPMSTFCVGCTIGKY